jgi:nitronate monooxygenase
MLNTRVSRIFDIDTPILGAPMAQAAGAELAQAVTRAGGLGFLGGGYSDADWIDAQAAQLDGPPVGIGFITWKLANNPEVLTRAIERAPAAVFLSFGDIAPFEAEVHAAKLPLIAQVQTLADAQAAADAGADMIVAQGAEAGGHGERRATMTLVPEVADWLAQNHPDVPLIAAGGIADGRGFAAALMLGAEGVVLGSRLWASEEALVHPNFHAAAIAATGDDTMRSSIMDVARKLDWPTRFTARVLKNAFTERWKDDVAGLVAVAETEIPLWQEALVSGDATRANAFVGEATGLLQDIRPAADLIHEITQETVALLARAPQMLEA